MQDLIKRMAEEADAHADAMDGSGQLGHKTWRQVREEYFAQAVARECAEMCGAKASDRHLATLREEGWNFAELNAASSMVESLADQIRARFGIEGE